MLSMIPNTYAFQLFDEIPNSCFTLSNWEKLGRLDEPFDFDFLSL